MSIFSSFVAAVQKGGISAIPGALQNAFDQTVAWEKALVAKAEANPTYGNLIKAAVDDTNQLVQTASEWAGTAIEGDLQNYSEELATLIVKYAPKILGGALAGSPAGATLLGALTDVGVAVVQHEVLALQGASASVASTTPAGSTAAAAVQGS